MLNPSLSRLIFVRDQNVEDIKVDSIVERKGSMFYLILILNIHNYLFNLDLISKSAFPKLNRQNISAFYSTFQSLKYGYSIFPPQLYQRYISITLSTPKIPSISLLFISHVPSRSLELIHIMMMMSPYLLANDPIPGSTLRATHTSPVDQGAAFRASRGGYHRRKGCRDSLYCADCGIVRVVALCDLLEPQGSSARITDSMQGEEAFPAQPMRLDWDDIITVNYPFSQLSIDVILQRYHRCARITPWYRVHSRLRHWVNSCSGLDNLGGGELRVQSVVSGAMDTERVAMMFENTNSDEDKQGEKHQHTTNNTDITAFRPRRLHSRGNSLRHAWFLVIHDLLESTVMAVFRIQCLSWVGEHREHHSLRVRDGDGGFIG